MVKRVTSKFDHDEILGSIPSGGNFFAFLIFRMKIIVDITIERNTLQAAMKIHFSLSDLFGGKFTQPLISGGVPFLQNKKCY